MYSMGKGYYCQSFSVVTSATGTQGDSLVFGIYIRVSADCAKPDEARVQEHLFLLLLSGQAPDTEETDKRAARE